MKHKLIIFLLFPALSAYSQNYIAGHTVAKQEVLRKIPVQYISAARENFHIAYQHTSHGTHVSRGMFGLPDFKSGDDTLFAITGNGTPVNSKLDFHDYAIPAAADLSQNETAFIQATRDFLDDAANADVNVVMWSWCSIVGHDVSGNYLPGMQTLINEYGIGGSKIGTGAGQRTTPVHFIFMTGHAETYNVGTGKPKNQADLIINYCNAHNYYCLDYYSIDAYDMNDNYWEDATDDGSSATGGSYFADWQTAHTLGVDWYENKTSPGGSVAYGEHNNQHITANRKAFAMWWILARLAGWDGNLTPTSNAGLSTSFNSKINLFPNPSKGIVNMKVNKTQNENLIVKIYNTNGQHVKEIHFNPVSQDNRQVSLNLTNLPNGIYICKLLVGNQQFIEKVNIVK